MERLKDLELPRREYVSDMAELPQYEYFITDDELNVALSGGSGFAGGRGRIYEFFQQPHTQNEKADFFERICYTGKKSGCIGKSAKNM